MALNERGDFHEVYDANIGKIYAYCLRRIGLADAQDAAAEVFLVLWRRWPDRPPEPELTPWIYGVARNVLANRNRAARRQVRLRAKLIGLRQSVGSEPEAATLVREDHEAVVRALAKLPQAHQETLRLIEWEGLSRDQVADIFGITRTAVDQRVSRAYRRMARLLGGETNSPADAVPIFGEER